MRTLSIVLFLAFWSINCTLNAQNEREQGMRAPHGYNHGGEGRDVNSHDWIPNLTEEQKAKIKDLRLTFYKTIQPLRNQLDELKAKEHSLATAEKPDMKAINANIDEITKIQNQIMKANASHHQEIRGLLTDEQKMKFDARPMRGQGKRGMNKGFQFAGTPNKL